MKIFSNFDTEQKKKMYQKAVTEFSSEYVQLIDRYGIFFIYFCLPSLIMIGLIIIMYLYLWINIDEKLLDTNIKILIGIIGIIPMLVSLLRTIIKKYIDYKMDFCIVTPQEITAHNQTGLFESKQRVIRTEKVKTITFHKKNLISSIFNFGNVDILSEGDEESKGDIKLTYVYDPETVKEKLDKIVDKGVEMNK